MDLRKETIDDLQEMLRDIKNEIDKRDEEEKVKCLRVQVGMTKQWCKNIADVVTEFQDYMCDVLHADSNAQFYVVPEEIPRSDYDMRPDIWYGA